MSEHSQIEVPRSFIALFEQPGSARLSAPLSEIAERHELCDDLAQALSERARAQMFELGITENDVLHKIEQGLRLEGSGLDTAEAGWVVGRLAEVLGWPWPVDPVS